MPRSGAQFQEDGIRLSWAPVMGSVSFQNFSPVSASHTNMLTSGTDCPDGTVHLFLVMPLRARDLTHLNCTFPVTMTGLLPSRGCCEDKRPFMSHARSLPGMRRCSLLAASPAGVVWVNHPCHWMREVVKHLRPEENKCLMEGRASASAWWSSRTASGPWRALPCLFHRWWTNFCWVWRWVFSFLDHIWKTFVEPGRFTVATLQDPCTGDHHVYFPSELSLLQTELWSLGGKWSDLFIFVSSNVCKYTVLFHMDPQ